MNKRDKQLEKKIITALTADCENFKSSIDGFSWLTHLINFSAKENISIICVFDTNEQLQDAAKLNQTDMIIKTITATLKTMDVIIKKPYKQITMDSEENCNLSHKGDWQQRFKQIIN